MIGKVLAVSGIFSLSGAEVSHSTSINSELDSALIAARQTRITKGLEQQKKRREGTKEVNHHESGSCERDWASEQDIAHVDTQQKNTEKERLSGESVRIGTGNFEKDAPFGDHVGFV